ncbi:MAG: NAD(P)(+) transhydrogenase (Re/Si-specific) subunit beta, partial [Caulobacter sp.]|nr:NAD(P)(+) transhydrogenase (Re/Si-specific) subunit beta [Caulobacter sp.]
AFHSLVGMAACLVAVAAIYTPAAYGIVNAQGHIHLNSLIELSLGLAIGAITFTGSVIAFAKLNGNMGGAPILLPARHLLNIVIALAIVAMVVVLVISGGSAIWAFWAIFALSLLIGVTLIIPIGGADMPVVVSMLNSYSGWAAAALGFTLENTTLIITGIMKNASKVIIVPGYGMAVSKAQHILREMCDKLKEEGVEVKYAIHPVAGRMPGHMNVLLAEANVPYDEVFELEDINSEFSTADVAFVIGANDVTNPAAKTDPQSPIFGMPILDVEKARTVLFIKRGMSSGYAGVENELFFRDNTMMLFGDAKKMVEGIVKGL